MTADEHRQALLQDLREVCAETVKKLEALRPAHDYYMRILDVLEAVTLDRDFANRGALPAGYARWPFGAWLHELLNGLGDGYKIR